MATCDVDTYRYLFIYYEHLFPFQDICTWLGYGKVETFSRREFSLKLSNELIIRNQAFSIPRQFMVRALGELPIGIDIGAIYKTSPSSKNLPKSPVEKEFIFDIDISDYDSVRSCCKGSNICTKCWKYIVIACKILHRTLKYDFGCNNFFWVFSGRRGIHCWVCDESMRRLNGEVRKGILQYIFNGNKIRTNMKKMLYGKKLDYYNRCAIEIIEPEFVLLCIIDQNLLGTTEGVDYFLSLLPNNEARIDVKQLFKKHQSSIDRWNSFVVYHNDMIHSQTYYWQDWQEFLSYVKLYYCSPRFDANVTKDVTHLLKCPFSVHPETGKIAVPFDIDEVELFDPSKTPTLKELSDEITILRRNLSSEKEKKAINIYEKTSLKKSVDILKKFVQNIEL